MLSRGEDGSCGDVLPEKVREIAGGADIAVKGDADIADGVNKGDPVVFHDDGWNKVLGLNHVVELAQYLRLRRQIGDAFSVYQGVILVFGQQTGCFVGLSPLLPLAFQGDPLVAGVVDPDAEFFSGISALFVFVKAPVGVIVKIHAADGVLTVLRVAVILHECLQPGADDGLLNFAALIFDLVAEFAVLDHGNTPF